MNEVERIKQEYADRKKRLEGSGMYSLTNPAHLFAVHQRQRIMAKILRKKDMSDISSRLILEVGSGEGGILTELLRFGASARNVYGVDLLLDRIKYARRELPACRLVNANGARLPFPAGSFDLILQFTAMSSILSSDLRADVAQDMARALKPDGFILWYDFWINPFNPQTQGLRPAEIYRLFPNYNIEFHRTTLAPPIARRIVPYSWGFAQFLESLKIFNSHYFAVIASQTSRNL